MNGELLRLQWRSLGQQRGAVEVSGALNLYYATQLEGLPAFMPNPVSRAADQITRVASFVDAGRMSALGSAFCAVLPGDKPQVTVFSEVELGGRTFPIHLRGAQYLAQGAADFAGINVVTGLCLFGGRTLRFVDEDGEASVLIG